MNNKINLAYLYPDILNLHGDKGNILAFERIGKLMNLEINTIRIDSPDDKLDFSSYDIVLLSPGELKVMPTIIKALDKYKEDINKFIEDEKYLFAIGTTGAAFGNKIKRLSGKEENGLRLIDMNVKETPSVYGDDLYFKAEINDKKFDIMSCQINVMETSLAEGNKTFGVTKYGYGNDKSGEEGARKNNLIFTNALGPVFIKNPWLVKEILSDIAGKKGIKYSDKTTDFSLEENSMNAIKDFTERKPPVGI